MNKHESTEMDAASILELLATGELEVQGMLPWSSNYTLLASVQCKDMQGLGVYKPRRGERPLWDFPRGTLCQRETATYILSEMLGWLLVPPTVLRDGPYGIGSVQLFIDANHEEHLFTMQQEGGFEFQIERLSAFDFLANNADRKSGHCLKGSDGRIWAIDHGLCFHTEYKLRTVLWDFAGQDLRSDIFEDVCKLHERMHAKDPAFDIFDQLLSQSEVHALRRRIDTLVHTGKHPEPGSSHCVPWPPV